MSLNTLQMRKSHKGEKLEDYLQRQRIIDEYQRNEIDPVCTWTSEHGWGDSYDIDADERAEESMLRDMEREAWSDRWASSSSDSIRVSHGRWIPTSDNQL
jgi:hypothetical protein